MSVIVYKWELVLSLWSPASGDSLEQNEAYVSILSFSDVVWDYHTLSSVVLRIYVTDTVQLNSSV